MDNSNAMVASNLSWDKGYPITTSGSSGDKLKFYVTMMYSRKRQHLICEHILSKGKDV